MSSGLLVADGPAPPKGPSIHPKGGQISSGLRSEPGTRQPSSLSRYSSNREKRTFANIPNTPEHSRTSRTLSNCNRPLLRVPSPPPSPSHTHSLSDLAPTLRTHSRCTPDSLTILSPHTPTLRCTLRPSPLSHRVVSVALNPDSRSVSPSFRLPCSGLPLPDRSPLCALPCKVSARLAARCALRRASVRYAPLRSRTSLTLTPGPLSVVCSALQADHTLAVRRSTVTTLRDYRRVSYSGFGSVSIRCH